MNCYSKCFARQVNRFKFKTVIFNRCASTRNHYDTLELTPKASQTEIKQAYYKLCIKFHPDKEKGNDEKFREISDAYEVLGNMRTRKLYDKGMFQHDQMRSDPSEPDITSEFFKNSKSKMPSTGRSTIYDFDSWTKAHYSNTFNAQESKKAKAHMRATVQDLRAGSRSLEIIFFIFVFGTLALAIAASPSMLVDPDNPKKSVVTKPK